jgi:CRP-like cAMP-binding protein
MLQKRRDRPGTEPRDSIWFSKIGEDRGVINRNHILSSLPDATLKRILPDLEPLNTVAGQVIDQVGRPIEYIYFVNRGLVSFVKTMRDGRTVEVGAVGIEGITHPNALFCIDEAIVGSIVQIPGTAVRIRRDILRREMERDAELLDTMHKCARFAISQLVQTAACNRLHSLEERCCRWLLIAHDNALAKSFPLTHEFLAMMLGVQRAGVTIAARFLQKAGLIQYTRGRVTITDQSGLKDVACECYGTMREELKRLFGTRKRR